MKTVIRFIILSFAATLTLVSCTKEQFDVQGDDNIQPDGIRAISVSFGNTTRTTLDGLQPQFAEKDEILLCTDTENPETETCEVKFDENGNAVIYTKLGGCLHAYYPAKYVKKDEKINLCTPATQTGKFADANLVYAQIGENDNGALFKNITALFIITPPEGTTKLTIKSLKPIENGVARTGQAVPINMDGTDDAAKQVITVSGKDADGKIYVSLEQNVKLSDLSFDASFETEGKGSMKGLPINVIQAGADNAKLGYEDFNKVSAGKIYTITNDDNWHEYATIGGRKWATMNIGAESPTDAGYYLAWGATEVAYDSFDGAKFVFKKNKPKSYCSDYEWTPELGFDNKNTPFADKDGNPDSRYYRSIDNKSILDLHDDAAYVNWGGAWRMPQSDEFGSSINFNSAVTKEYVPGPTAGFNVSQNGIKLFLPYTRPASGLKLDPYGWGGYWFSGIINYMSPTQPNYLQMSSSGSGSLGQSSSTGRCLGRPIRAIVGE